MKLTILGSGCIYPDAARGGPAFLVTESDSHLLLDAGPGAMRALKRAGLDPTDLFALCITHRHLDHISEMLLCLELQKTLGRTDPLLLAGPAILDDLVGFFLAFGKEEPSSLPYPLERLILPGAGKNGPFLIRGEPVPHVDHSVGYRLSCGGRTLVYPGDCGPGNEVVSLARNADLLLLECSLPGGIHSAAHLCPEDAAAIAAESGCRRLILTHLPPDADAQEAANVCRTRGLDVTVASDGAVFQV